ncbi:MAG: hypothetical protein GY747_03705 [Planctomycetes bacterium]|nr:hypothetical protein [Planctomycetota bacterium]MCP4771070.1 hypothetical protein [Planctomycetota bacterium]MCP4861628.1 hypothetical protein [Planctomycetota bacterium]
MSTLSRSLSLPTRSLAVLLLGGFVACSHPGPGVANITGGATGGGTVDPPPIVFSLDDMEGDWFGQLTPDSLARDVRNFYFTVVGGQIVESADSLGNQWTSIDTTSLDFNVDGVMAANIESVLVTNNLVLTAQMNDALSTLTGEFSHLNAADILIEGSFVLKRSMGAGQFSADLMDGVWKGTGANSRGKRRFIELTLDVAGAVLSGQMIRPHDSFVQHTYSASAANVFTLTNDSVGRMDNVQINADDGSVLFFTYALIDEDGTLIGGPGFDSLLGSGVAGLSKVDPAPAAE